MISSDLIRGHTDTMILFIVYERANYGYEISKQIRELSNEKYIMKETTLYSTLKRLETNGYLTSFVSDEIGGKKRTYYEISDLGKSYYQSRLEEWKLIQEVVNQFIVKEL
ncbi:MAG: PadR family transcriptional regulator [Erysipelothrix sp.]|nr:PadR family transcriptional regulator [Erysipelothrix sp.]